ncbi:MAG: dTMP kinase [Spirochaetaceae bacterium]|nr:dTMP kinase [Spirochaetaceae bacterium]
MSGKFIVFEGIDGSGTSTQAQLLQDYLISNSRKALSTAEPSPGPIGNMIREIHTKRIAVTDDRNSREKLLSYLFAADRCDHLYNSINGIIKQVEAGYYVLSTRYYLSSLAYHVFNTDDFEYVYQLNKDFPLPDYTFYLDCPIDRALRRISVSRVPDINEEQSNLRRVYENYHIALARYPGAFSVIDALQNPADVHARIKSILSEKGIL